MYGLPETLNEPYHTNLKSKLQKPKTFDVEEQRAINRIKFAKLFNIHRGPTWEKNMKTPKFDESFYSEEENGIHCLIFVLSHI